MQVTIYHNPRCSKSRRTLELLREHGVEPIIVEYLKTPPDAATLKHLLRLLGMAPRDLLRKGEKDYQEAGLHNPAVRRGPDQSHGAAPHPHRAAHRSSRK